MIYGYRIVSPESASTQNDLGPIRVEILLRLTGIEPHENLMGLGEPLSVSAAILTIILSTSIALFAYRYYKDIMNPLSLFMIAWFVPYGLYQFYPYPPEIQPRLSALAHIAIISSGIAFLIGHLIASPPSVPIEQNVQRFEHSKFVVILATSSIVFISSLAFLVQFQGAGGIEGIITNSDIYERNFFHPPIIDDAFNLIFLAVFLAIAYLKRTRAPLIIVLIGFLFSIFSLHRQRVILVTMLVICGVNYYHYRIQLRDALFIGSITTIGLVAIVSMLSWGLTGGTIGRSGIILHPVITQLYWYTAMGIQNVEVAVSQVPPNKIGLPVFTLEFFWTLTGLRQVISTWVGLGGEISNPFNMKFGTWSFIIPFYTDAGLIGVLIGSGLVGYGSSRIYAMIRRKQSIEMVFLYSLISAALVMSFFNNWFTKPLLWKLALQFGLLLAVMNLTEKYFMTILLTPLKSMDAEIALRNSISYSIYDRITTVIFPLLSYIPTHSRLKTKLQIAWKNSAVVSIFRI